MRSKDQRDGESNTTVRCLCVELQVVYASSIIEFILFS